jgi:ADP-heptose:LPS heptosyltransferase
LTPKEKDWALNYLKSKGIDINKKIVGIHPGATWPAKMWLKENFAILADKITSKTDASVVITHSREGDKSCFGSL